MLLFIDYLMIINERYIVSILLVGIGLWYCFCISLYINSNYIVNLVEIVIYILMYLCLLICV